ncbi:MAG: HTH domain-containing protein, partial [Pyrinomonadaceae bacterium]|nr:HTH domain-containing protein [Pyrinomonadaceae bacterium]
MLPRTQRQKEILDYLTRFLERHGHEPSYAQIARHFGVKSRATIAKHVAALEKRGLLTRKNEDGAFALTVKIDESDALCEVRLLGYVAA